MPLEITLILTATMNIVFIFLNDVLNAKSNVAVYKGHMHFKKEVAKSSQLAG